jgi:hypothetical protein
MSAADDQVVVDIQHHISKLPDIEKIRVHTFANAFRAILNGNESALLAFSLVGAQLSAAVPDDHPLKGN